MKDFALVYQNFFKALKDHIKGLPVLFLAFILYLTVTNLTNSLFMAMGSSIFVGLIRWFIRLAILTHLAGLMTRLLRRGSLSMEDLVEYDGGYLAPLSQVLFAFYLIDMIINMLGGASFITTTVFVGLYLVWSAFTAPAYEAVYQSGETINTIFPSLLRFWKENLLLLIPYIVLVFLIYRTVGMAWSVLAALPGTGSFPYIVGYAFLNALFYYSKGIFFRYLSGSSKRSRAYHERSRH